MKLTFIYKGTIKPPKQYEIFTTKVTELVKQVYVLPDVIEIQFEDMDSSLYGMTMLDPRFPNRVRINQNLTLEEYLLPLTHELLHLHQIFTNQLQSRSGGRILWQNELYKVDTVKLSYTEYQNLPWEYDVIQKQTKLLQFINSNSKKIINQISKEMHFAQNSTNSNLNL